MKQFGIRLLFCISTIHVESMLKHWGHFLCQRYSVLYVASVAIWQLMSKSFIMSFGRGEKLGKVMNFQVDIS